MDPNIPSTPLFLSKEKTYAISIHT